MKPAVLPRRGPRRAKLLVIDACGRITHHVAADLPRFVRRGDLIVANDAATLPASLAATHVRSGEPVEIRLAARRSLAPSAVTTFTAVVFGAGDYRTPTEHRAAPPAFSVGDKLIVGPLRARIVAVHDHPRLVDIRFDDGVDEIWAAFARHGQPIQYSYIPERLAMWDTWTSIASQPVAFEAPSAGFVLDWSTLRELGARGVRVASITHAAGISSTGDPDLDRLLPLDEPYVIPAATATLVNRTKQRGSRVLAVGTTVVRALEHAARCTGQVKAGGGVATGRIGAQTRLLVVDGIVSGMHEPGTSHYELLRAFQEDGALERMAAEAEDHEYRSHEFGDAVLIERFGRLGFEQPLLSRRLFLRDSGLSSCRNRETPVASTSQTVALEVGCVRPAVCRGVPEPSLPKKRHAVREHHHECLDDSRSDRNGTDPN